jgi:hypothetical protein
MSLGTLCISYAEDPLNQTIIDYIINIDAVIYYWSFCYLELNDIFTNLFKCLTFSTSKLPIFHYAFGSGVGIINYKIHKYSTFLFNCHKYSKIFHFLYLTIRNFAFPLLIFHFLYSYSISSTHLSQTFHFLYFGTIR